MGRTAVLKKLKSKLEDIPEVRIVRAKQKDWQTEPEYPVAYVFYPNQIFDYRKISGTTLNALKGKGLVTIRVVVENSDDTPEFELDELLDTILLALLQDTTLGGEAKTTDILQVQTDGGVIITHSIGDISIEVQI